MRLFRKRHEELDARVEDAQQRAKDAAWEAKVSEQRSEAVEKNIVEPLRKAAMHNQFAELIRQSLGGNGNHHHQGAGNA